MHFGVLGSIEASEKRRRLAVGGPKQRTVLALLIARVGTSVSTEALIDGLYGDDPPQGARRSIHTYVSNLRGNLGDVIEADGSGYVLRVDRSGVDALRFEDAVAEAADVTDPESASELLREALSLWRGHPYEDVDGLFELTAERSRLSELRMSAVELRVDADLERGHHRQLIAELESLTEEHPLREGFRAQQMLALYRCGRQAEALRAYEKTRNYLVDEMGLDPSPDLRDLEQRILDHDPSLGFESGPAVKNASILVADVADPRVLSTLDPTDRHNIITHQSDAIRHAVEENDGDLFAHRGSAIYVAFDDVEHAVSAAVATQKALADTDQGMRMAISVGEVEIAQEDGVLGPPVTRATRLVAAAHGGQILLSAEANQALAESGGAGWVVRSLGQQSVDGSDEGRPVYQLTVDGLGQDFPPIRTELLPLTLPTSTRGLPGYELREEVGSGAFGVVHRAYQPSVGREVAIKVIRPEYVNDPQFIRRFEVEAQLVARLEHPHIVPLHDYWRNPDGAYLVMRWLGGGRLMDQVAQGDLTIDQAHSVLADIGPALAFAHRRGVVHRDIKLSNVLFDDEGGAYLTDFGIASDIALQGVGSVAQDVQALAGLLAQCIGSTDEQAVANLLAEATATENFPDVHSFIAAWEQAVGTGDTTSQAVGFTQTRNPYKGLSAFGEFDAADFHGRDAEIDEIVNTLEDHRLVAVVGPSGIGKSSIVRAGMIPALRTNAIPGSEQWLIMDMLPGAYPYEELATALMRVATEIPSSLEDDLRRDARGLMRSVKRYLPEGETILLVIDQFEELFTLTSGDEREAFLAMLAASIDDDRSNVRIVITMRADFFDHPLRFAALGDALRAGTVPISAPNENSLRSMIAEPAVGVGIAFEAGLVDLIVVDVRNQPGALPLLEFSLTELFDDRESDEITLQAYGKSGGVLAALGRRAEGIYESLEGAEQDASRETFLRLVSVSDSGRATRRRARRTELERLGFSDVTLGAVLDAFVDHRLVTFDRDPITRGPTVEVAHEAIFSEWPRLADWIEDHREDLLLRSRLAVAVTDWEAADRSETYLLTGGRLDQHESWTTDTELRLTSAEQEFLRASRHAEDERRARRRRNRRLVMSGFGVAAVIALVLAAAALIARNDAGEKATLAESRALAAAAVGVLEENPELSLLLSVQSANTASLDSEGREALRVSVAEHKTIQSISFDHRRLWMVWPSTSPDGTMVAVNGSREDIEVWDISGDEPALLWHLELDHGYGGISLFTEDSSQVGISVVWMASEDITLEPEPPDQSIIKGIHYYDARTGEFLRHVAPTDTRCTSQWGPQQHWNDFTKIDPNGAWVEDGTCTDLEGRHWWLFDPETGARASEPKPVDADVGLLSITAGGWLLEATQDSVTMTNVYTDEVRVVSAEVVFPMFSPEAKILIGREEFFDGETGEPLWRFLEDEVDFGGFIPPCLPVEWNADETVSYVTCDTGVARVHDARTGRLIDTLRGHSGWVSASSDASGDILVTGSADGTVRVWDLTRPRGTRSFRLGTGYYADASLQVVGNIGTVLIYPDETSTPFDNAVSAMSRVSPGVAVVFDVDTGDEIARIDSVGGKVVRLSPDGTRVAGQSVAESGAAVGPVLVHDVPGTSNAIEMQGTCEWEPPMGASEECGLAGSPFALDVTDLHWSPDGSMLAATAGRSQRVIVWDTQSGDVVFATDQLGFYPFSSVQFSPDGALLAASSKTGMWVYATDDWSEIAMVPHPGRPSWAMRFTPDGSQIVTAQAHRGQIRVYDTETWEERDIATGLGQSRDLAISPSGELVALANNVGVVHIVELTSGEILETYPLPNTDITNVEFVHDDRHVLVTDAFGPVEVLTLDTEELLEVARSRTIRTFSTEECDRYSIDPCPTLGEIRAG